MLLLVLLALLIGVTRYFLYESVAQQHVSNFHHPYIIACSLQQHKFVLQLRPSTIFRFAMLPTESLIVVMRRCIRKLEPLAKKELDRLSCLFMFIFMDSCLATVSLGHAVYLERSIPLQDRICYRLDQTDLYATFPFLSTVLSRRFIHHVYCHI